MVGAAQAYTNLTEEQKKVLKETSQNVEVKTGSKNKKSIEESVKELNKVATKIYANHGIHVLAYATVRKSQASFLHVEDYSVFGTGNYCCV